MKQNVSCACDTNPSCSTSTPSSSSTSVGVTSDPTLLVENDILKKEVDKLTIALGKAYGGETRLLKCLGSQRFSHLKEGLGYIPKKGKAACVTPKPSFVRSNGSFCSSCKQPGHNEHYCKNKIKKQTFVSSIMFDSCYMLTKGKIGVKVKYIGTPTVGPRKKAIWVPKNLITNLQGPKNAWVPKNN